MDKIITGAQGERVAAEYFAKMGYSIFTRNYRKKFGEIDLIARLDKQIVFIEVKTRSRKSDWDPNRGINFYKRCRIRKTINMFLASTGLDQEIEAIRFDIVFVTQERVEFHFENEQL